MARRGPLARATDLLSQLSHGLAAGALEPAAAPAVLLQLSALQIVVEDSGIGFDPDAALAAGRTFAGMQQRAQLLGGWLQLRSAPGNGTTAELPVEDAECRFR